MKSKQTQMSLFWPTPLTHGGEHAKGRRKSVRPIDPKRSLHVTFRASGARGEWSLLRRPRSVRAILDKMAKRFGIRIYQYANVGNHLHLLLKGRSRADIQNFLRATTGLIARLMTGAHKGCPKGKFWDMLTFTRAVNWGKAFRVAKAYVLQNLYEAEGLIPYRPRKKIKKARNGSLQFGPSRLKILTRTSTKRCGAPFRKFVEQSSLQARSNG